MQRKVTPRRGRVDHEGRLWFAEYQGNAIGKCPGTLWIGSNHGASIVKVEPLE